METRTPWRGTYVCALLLVGVSFAFYASQFSPHGRWIADNFDPADYRLVAEHFWRVDVQPATYEPGWNHDRSGYLRIVPFRGIGLGTIYLTAAWLTMGRLPSTIEQVNTVGVRLAVAEKILLAIALLVLFEAIRRRWGTIAAFGALALTTFPPYYWRMSDDFIAEPVERIIFLFALACAVAMRDRKSTERGAFALAALFLVAAHLKVQWYVGAFFLFPAILAQFRAEAVSLRTSVLMSAAVAAIPLSVMAVNWTGWRTMSLSPGIGLHVNLKYHGDVLREFTARLSAQQRRPAFTDPSRPALNWWQIYVGGDVLPEDYGAFDRFALEYVRAHPKTALRDFAEGVALASTVPAIQHVENDHIRLRSLEEPWLALVHGFDLALWVLLIVGLRFPETRVICALGLALWIVPALGNVFSLYEVRYHVPMAGLSAVAAWSAVEHLLRLRQGFRLLVPSTAVQ